MKKDEEFVWPMFRVIKALNWTRDEWHLMKCWCAKVLGGNNFVKLSDEEIVQGEILYEQCKEFLKNNQ